MGEATLTPPFLAALAPGLRAHFAGEPALEARLAAALAEATGSLPSVTLSAARAVALWGARIEEPSLDALAALRTSDLVLAAACLEGDRAALALLDTQLQQEVSQSLARRTGPSTFVEDVTQLMRQHLLVGSEGGPPKLGDYAGRGELRHWLRAVATRTALNLMRTFKDCEALGDEQMFQMPLTEDPELEHMKLRYQEDFKAAFREALAELAPQDRTLMRQYYLDGLTFEEVAVLLQVHTATAFRRVQRIREALLASTRRRLTDRLSVTTDEFDSIMRLIQSGLDMSMRGLKSDPER